LVWGKMEDSVQMPTAVKGASDRNPWRRQSQKQLISSQVSSGIKCSSGILKQEDSCTTDSKMRRKQKFIVLQQMIGLVKETETRISNLNNNTQSLFWKWRMKVESPKATRGSI
jgi:hypothetical protein